MGLLYTKMKIFHFKEKLDSLSKSIDGVLPPIHIRIKPTNVCNHRCSYCAYRAEGLQLGQDMIEKDSIPKDKMLEIIDDIIEMGVQAVTFSGGGEPFFYPHLLDTAKKLADSPVQFASLTNGAKLLGEVAEIFAHNAAWVRISMDGWDGASYSAYRGVPEDEFARVINNIENFKKYGGSCYLGVSFIVDQRNSDHVYDFLKMMQGLGVNSVKVSPCIISNEGAKNNAYHAPFFEQVKNDVAKAVNDFAGDSFEIFDSYHELDSKFEKQHEWCPYQQILPIIGADCNVYSCQDKAYNLKEGLIGSIADQRLVDFWFNDKDKFFQINPYLHCNHHCVANDRNKLVLEYLDVDKGHLGFV